MRSQYNTSFKKLFNEGKLLFNSGEFYDAHIVWEHIWKEGDAEEKILKVSFSYQQKHGNTTKEIIKQLNIP